MSRSGRSAALVLLAMVLALGAPIPVAADPYADATKVNLFRVVEGDGRFAVQHEWINILPSGGVQYSSYFGLDMAQYATQLDFGEARTTNTAAFRISLPAAVHIQQLRHSYHSHHALQYRILTSTSGFESLSEVVGWTDVDGNDNPPADTVDIVARYVQLEFLGTETQYLLISEIQAYAAAADTIEDTAGYNLFCQRATAGPIPNDALHRGGSWGDNPANAIDLDKATYLRGNLTATPSWIVIPLNDHYLLTGAAAGFYHGQPWPSMGIYVTADPVIKVTNNWTEVFYSDATVNSQTIGFDMPYNARAVKILNPSGTWNALCEFEVYAIPPPPGTVMCLR